MASWVAVIMVCFGTEIGQCNVAVYPTSYYNLSDCQDKLEQGFRMAKASGMLVSGSCSRVKLEGTDL